MIAGQTGRRQRQTLDPLSQAARRTPCPSKAGCPGPPTKAYFTAAVLVGGQLDVPGEGPKARLRYLTLELAASKSETPRTVLGEWTPDGMHLNYGDGPAPELSAFLKTLESCVP